MNKLRRWLIEKLGGTVWTPDTGIQEVHRQPAVSLKVCDHYPQELSGALGERLDEIALGRLEGEIGHAIVGEKLYDMRVRDGESPYYKVYEMEVLVVPPKGE